MIRIVICICLLTSFSFWSAHAQKGETEVSIASGIDYLAIKKAYALSCSIPDSASILRSKHLLDSLATFEIVTVRKNFMTTEAGRIISAI